MLSMKLESVGPNPLQVHGAMGKNSSISVYLKTKQWEGKRTLLLCFFFRRFKMRQVYIWAAYYLIVYFLIWNMPNSIYVKIILVIDLLYAAFFYFGMKKFAHKIDLSNLAKNNATVSSERQLLEVINGFILYALLTNAQMHFWGLTVILNAFFLVSTMRLLNASISSVQRS